MNARTGATPDLPAAGSNKRFRQAAAAVVLLAAATAAWLTLGQAKDEGRHMPTDKAFFTTDDGATFFADDAAKSSGFDHSGLPAYRAYVFRQNGGQPFVGYLERMAPESRTKLDKLGGDPRKRNDPNAMRSIVAAQEIKKPGDDRWCKRSSNEAQSVIAIHGPDGSADGLEPVAP